jgi:hypothetical protein
MADLDKLAVAEPTTIGGRLQEMATNVAVRADATAAAAETILGPLMDMRDLAETEGNKAVPDVVWPPFFDTLRGQLQLIDRALDNINNTLNKVAL